MVMSRVGLEAYLFLVSFVTWYNCYSKYKPGLFVLIWLKDYMSAICFKRVTNLI